MISPEVFEKFVAPYDAELIDTAHTAGLRIGHRVCLIGGFDQFHYFKSNTKEETRAAVRRCFEEAGKGGGYILAPSDHFFDADIDLLKAFIDEAKKCFY